MKKCENCGMVYSDYSNFCTQCGQKLGQTGTIPQNTSGFTPETEAQTTPRQGYQGFNPVYSPGYQPSAHATGFSAPGKAVPNGEVMRKVRELGSSQLMLIFTIIWFAKVGLFVFARLFNPLSSSSSVFNLLNFLDIDGLNAVVFTYNEISSISTLINLIPTVLVGVGLVMTYLSAGDKTPSMSPSGLTIIKVIYIIEFIFKCIAIAFLLILSVAAIVGGNSEFIEDLIGYGYGDEIRIIGIILLVAVLIGGTCIVLFNVFVLGFLGSLTATIRSNVPQEKFASILSVLMFILGAFSALNLFGALQRLTFSPGSAFLSFVISASEVAVLILQGVLINKYKNIVRYGQ